MTERVLAAAIDIRSWLAEDRLRPYAERLARDREIAGRIPDGPPLARVLAWWDEVAAQPGTGGRVVRLRRVATGLLFAAGLALGAGAGGLGFGYEGRHPVNLLALLALLVGVPLVLLLFTLVLLVTRVRGGGALRDALAGLNPARWVGGWLDRYAGGELFAALASGGAAGPFARWQLVVFSQWLAVGFFVAVLAAAWLAVVFTDLAFGWSTTLDADPGAVHGWLLLVATPWRDWLPVAVPDAELVAASRFFRLEGAAGRAARLGDWWPFLLMTITVYGLLPRVLLLIAGRWRLGRATRSLLLEDPEVTALLERLAAPRVGYAAEPDAPAGGAAPAPLPGPGALPADARMRVVIWNDALTAAAGARWVAARFAVAAPEPLALSIVQEPAALREVLAGLDGNVDRIVVFTKGWEPPLLEFEDVLRQLRELVGARPSVVVVPIDVAGGAVQPAERDVWARALAGLGDPSLYVAEADVAGADA